MTVAANFYPSSEQHYIVTFHINLDTIAPAISQILPEIYKLAALGDAISTLHTANGECLNDQVARLLFQQSADLLTEIAAALPDPLAELLKMRAAGLSGKRSPQAAVLQVNILDETLILLCGPLSTWRGKSRRKMHSVIASVPLTDSNAMIYHADELLEFNVRYLQQLLGVPTLEIGSVPFFVVTDLIVCGGEANTYPKQFSYFLPEDEGVKNAEQKKTIVYANLYVTRFHRISLPLAQEIFLSSQQIDLTSYTSKQILLLWFRGHDIGHSFRLPETDYQRLRPIGLECSMMLQEAIADVIGYLLLLSDAWQQAFQLNPTECGIIFLAEMLRYIRRGPTWFVDSGAAFIELSYLVSNEYVLITEQGKKLFWQPDKLYTGIVGLAKELIDIVLRTDLEKAEALLAEHRFHAEHKLFSLYTRLAEDFCSIPTDFAYHNQHSEREMPK